MTAGDPRCRVMCIWLVAFVLSASVCWAHQVTHLRTGTVLGSPPRFQAGGRGLLQVEAQECADARWTVLCGRQQYLLQLRTGHGFTAAQERVLAARLHAHGAVVAGFLPPATWLLLAPASLREHPNATQPHTLTALQPHHKVSPELAALADLLAQEPGHWERLAAGTPAHLLPAPKAQAHSAHQGRRWGADAAADAAPAKHGALFGQLHVMRSPALTGGASRSAGNASQGAPAFDGPARLVVSVQFANVPAGQVPAGAAHEPAAAAAAEWGEPLARLAASRACVPEVHPHGRRLMVTVCPEDLSSVMDWLSQQPPVHWLAPRMAARLHNAAAAAIIQGARIEAGDDVTAPAAHPMWQAGLDGRGQVVGIGDSGITLQSCYFDDPKVPVEVARDRKGNRFFRSTEHRKLALYLALAGGGDFSDSVGHGTHTAGTVAGVKEDGSVDKGTGVAPGAKLSFLDLSSENSDVVLAPYDFGEGYASYSYEAGARIHSDSWGADVISYDEAAASVDQWTYDNPDFVSVFAAGNYGEAEQYKTTVTSPATSKNCIAAGASQTVLPRYDSQLDANVYTMRVTVRREGAASQGTQQRLEFRVVQASFGAPMDPLLGKSFPLLAASPINGCGALGDVAGAWVLVQRGGCYFADKMKSADGAGAVGIVVTDNEQSGYFLMEAPEGASDLKLPMVGVPVSIGRELWQLIDSTGTCGAGCGVSVRFEAYDESSLPSYEDIAAFSSFGPTQDGRIKPDIVAPGDTLSAASSGRAGASSGPVCELTRTQGTSMSTPVVAGALALIRQYFVDGFYPGGAADAAATHNPSGPLLKAVLLGGASNMMGNTEASLPLEPAPSFRQGYGLVNLTRSLPLADNAAGWRMQAVDMEELEQGASHTYCLNATGGPLSVMLVWYDPPGSPASETALVNDLDLAVTAAGLGSTTLFGNGWRDNLNPNERVLVEDLPAGPVVIKVTAQRIYSPLGPQKYALVALGRFSGALASDANPDPASRGAAEATDACAASAAALADAARTNATRASGDADPRANSSAVIPIAMPVFGGNTSGAASTPAAAVDLDEVVEVDPSLPSVAVVPPPPSTPQEPGQVTVEVAVAPGGAAATPVASVEVLVQPMGAADAAAAPVVSDDAAAPPSSSAGRRRRLAQAAPQGPYVVGGEDLTLGVWTRVPGTTGFTIAALPGGEFQMRVRTAGASGLVSEASSPYFFTVVPDSDATGSDSGSSDNLALILGLSLGIGIPLLLAAVLAVVMGLRRRSQHRQQRERAAAASPPPPYPQGPPPPPPVAVGVGPAYAPPFPVDPRYLHSSSALGGSRSPPPDAAVLVQSRTAGDKDLAAALAASEQEAALRASQVPGPTQERMRVWAWLQQEQERQQRLAAQPPPGA